MGARLLPQSYQYPNLSEGADRVGGQLRGDKCPFSGVIKSGGVWRKVPESEARSVVGGIKVEASGRDQGRNKWEGPGKRFCSVSSSYAADWPEVYLSIHFPCCSTHHWTAMLFSYHWTAVLFFYHWTDFGVALPLDRCIVLLPLERCIVLLPLDSFFVVL